MLSSSQSSSLSFIVHANYYELILHTHTSYALDEWVSKLDQIYRHHLETNNVICTLTRSTNSYAGLMPLHYVFSKGYQVLRAYPDLPKSRSVFMLGSDVFASSMERFSRFLPQGFEFRYLTDTQQDSAIQWLNELSLEAS